MPRATDVMPITGFTRAYQETCRELRKSGRPKVLTVDGKSAVVVQDAAAYDRLLDALYTAREAIKGLTDERPRVSIAESRARLAALARRNSRTSGTSNRAA